MTKGLVSIGKYGDLYYESKIHNRTLIENGLRENPKKNIRKKRASNNIKVEQNLERLRERKIEFLRSYKDLLNKPTEKLMKQPSVVKEVVSTTEDILYRKLLENRERHKDELRLHGEQTLIKVGFVYVIENTSFSGWVKVGMAFDYEKRLSVYNQYDPEKRYAIAGLRWTADRRVMESQIINEMGKHATKQSGEWFKIDIVNSLNIFYSLTE